ncbi:methyltransferase-like protein [Whalleya microplaca]|nr:methyltransferase-like protein [Whalleya microplaca]
MASAEVSRGEYNDQGVDYDNIFPTISIGILETQLLISALGDCTDLAVLDLGGGSGLRARQVLDLGASSVDVVDISLEMLRCGKTREYGNRITWHEANISKPLDHLPLQTYDLVMANWVMDHAATMAELEGMWANVTAYLKPGGRYVGTRSGDPYAPAALDGKYGMRYKDHQSIPGGVQFRYETASTPPIDIEATSMEISYSGSTELHAKFGLSEVEIEPYENAEVVRKDNEFWKLFLDKPFMAIVKAKKEI